jgi:cardiolipin synthase
MTLASGITLARLLLLPLMLLWLIEGERGRAFVLLLVILAGDFIDGTLARLRHEVTYLGKILDPVVDKLVFLGVFGALAWRGELSWAALAALAALQLGILVGALLWMRRRGEAPTARFLGKLASFILSIGLIAAFVQVPYAEWTVYGGIALGYAAGVDYLRRLIRVLREKLPESVPPNTAEIRAGEGP